jgi:hypothetical protein
MQSRACFKNQKNEREILHREEGVSWSENRPIQPTNKGKLGTINGIIDKNLGLANVHCLWKVHLSFSVLVPRKPQLHFILSSTYKAMTMIMATI